MSVEPKRIPFDEFIRDAPALFDDMERDGGQLARLTPERKRVRPRPRHCLMHDPLWGIIGSGRIHGRDRFAVMERLLIRRAWTYDHHFGQFGWQLEV